MTETAATDTAAPASKSGDVPLLAPGMTWEEMLPGTAFRTSARSITESDLMTFIQWAGFNEPLFVDATHAAAGGYTGRLVPGAFVYCIAEGLVLQTNALHGTGLAFLSMDLAVKGPTYVGDTLHAIVETLSARPTSKPGRGIVASRVTVRNQHGKDVMVFTPTRMIRGRDFAETDGAGH
nr:MaoC family dehydratase N-terminal domain-containing protein [Frankia sp. CiP3]